jgi:integrase
MKLARASVSARTEQAYADCWVHFSAWRERHRVSHLPADPAIVGADLAARAESVGKSSLRVSLAKLVYFDRRPGKPWGFNYPIIAFDHESVLRQQRRPKRLVAALTPTEIKAMLRTCGDDLASLRDRALLLTGFVGAPCSRSWWRWTLRTFASRRMA